MPFKFNPLTSNFDLVNPDVTASIGSPVGGAVGKRVLETDSSGNLVESGALTDGQLLIGKTGDTPQSGNLSGTANQITVTPGPGTLGLSLPQDINTTSSPTFDSINTDLIDAGASPLSLDGNGISASSQVISDVGEPLLSQDAATKNYVDSSIIPAMVAKEAVACVSTSNISSLVGPMTIDGVDIGGGDYVLLTGQTDPTENGIWVSKPPSVPWTRRSDADGADELKGGSTVYVIYGTEFADTTWVLIQYRPNEGVITPGSSVQFWALENEWNRETFTLSATDISNGYIDLAFLSDKNTIDLTVDNIGADLQRFGVDYTHSVNGNHITGVSRLTFAGDLASTIAENDVVRVKYLKRRKRTY